MWQTLLLWVFTTVLSALLAPRPKPPPDAQPSEIRARDVPTAAQGKPIPVLFGTRILAGPNVVWWGDVRVRPIRRSSGGGKK